MPSRLAPTELATILSVWAHPDDETFSCAGIMAAAAANGQRVVCVTATRGELGSTDPDRWPNGPALAEVRTAELSAALAEIGVSEHIWLDYPDGGCADIDEDEAAQRLRAIIADVRPDTILTFGPDGGTAHPDHMAVSRWVHRAAPGSDARILHTTHSPQWLERISKWVPLSAVMMDDSEPVAHAVDECAVYLDLEGDDLDRKFRAMSCQQSQIGPLVALTGLEEFRAMLAEEAFVDSE